jgi:hypothetical protein
MRDNSDWPEIPTLSLISQQIRPRDKRLWDQPVTPAAPRKSRTQCVIDYFVSHPNQWLDGLLFSTFGGVYGWRSRISNARKRGLTIRNRQRRLANGSVRSEYRYVPGGETNVD